MSPNISSHESWAAILSARSWIFYIKQFSHQYQGSTALLWCSWIFASWPQEGCLFISRSPFASWRKISSLNGTQSVLRVFSLS
jgi:hypothetical protein